MGKVHDERVYKYKVYCKYCKEYTFLPIRDVRDIFDDYMGICLTCPKCRDYSILLHSEGIKEYYDGTILDKRELKRLKFEVCKPEFKIISEVITVENKPTVYELAEEEALRIISNPERKKELIKKVKMRIESC